MNKLISKENENVQNSLDIVASGMLLLVYIATFIVIIVGLFKLLNNAKKNLQIEIFILKIIF